MSGIRNTNQKVTGQYDKNFIAIFGDKPIDNTLTGKYVYKDGVMIKVDSNIPQAVKDKMEPLTSQVHHVNPVNIKPKEINNADGMASNS